MARNATTDDPYDAPESLDDFFRHGELRVTKPIKK
jgi:hypothetical protein